MVEVDPEMVRRFAESLGQSEAALAKIDTLAPLEASEHALPGTEFNVFSATIAAAVSSSVLGLAGRLADVAEIARGVARDYVLTEDEFTQKLSSMDVPR